MAAARIKSIQTPKTPSGIEPATFRLVTKLSALTSASVDNAACAFVDEICYI
jgi:hypothetical protein